MLNIKNSPKVAFPQASVDLYKGEGFGQDIHCGQQIGWPKVWGRGHAVHGPGGAGQGVRWFMVREARHRGSGGS